LDRLAKCGDAPKLRMVALFSLQGGRRSRRTCPANPQSTIVKVLAIAASLRLWRCSCVFTYLPPEIVRSIVAGDQPIELTPTRLVALSRNLPLDWNERRRLLGFSSA
jgi:hypothetical protein